MFYFLSENQFPLQYVSSGKLLNQDYFLHTKRNLETFVILIGISGTLYIAQDDRKYELNENEFLVMFPGHEHYGWKESTKTVSYYWCHFKINKPYKLLTETEIDQQVFLMQSDNHYSAHSNVYILPEYGPLSAATRVVLLFRQLLDLSMQNCYSHYMLDYTLSSIAMEVSQEYVTSYTHKNNNSAVRYNILEIMEWIRINYKKQLTIQEIARTFNYNPNYLSSVFKKQTGFPLLRFIHLTKIGAAKKLLLNSTISIKEVAHKTGFSDEKTFMKLFKQLEDVTPTQYRNTFSRTKLNLE